MTHNRDLEIDNIIRSDIDEHVHDSNKDPAYYTGTEPWQLRHGEAASLGIDTARFPRMMWAWNFFEAFIGTIHPNDLNQPTEPFERARVVHKEILDQGATEAAFVAFADIYAALTPREAQFMFRKMNNVVNRKQGQG